ncbi:multifunctional CCA addition/repair protein [Natronospira bacteriovora]|uniref:Multifunctional CCA protein n=1 Tax=Natronospira bacteriovora TaxID=3069753 RepID=A0ABU0WA07_9GAMM|nr:multifunctional CCA addition/repair protein [Natronospira sp. AB-CW4]MDQ2070865.1 multifunctional CCA addition/repair protein [Natronospira sp. AB-CW4]
MKTYLVGGAVRDKLLGIPVKERDWVVVGATPDEMTDQGFRPVGRDFPVFLHPQTSEEYALARTERKSGRGYHGFRFHADPSVSLEEDLARRDLTVNAMAEDEQGRLIDPHGGRRDLEARCLRHVTEAFAEDPLRVLRVARFAARFHHLGFSIAGETLALMQDLSTAEELGALSPERVWQESERALGEAAPQVYFQVLRDCGALAHLFPEVDALFGVPQPARYHPEVDTGLHTLLVLEQAARLSKDTVVRFAALVHDLGKGVTPERYWPSHHGHEKKGVKQVQNLCRRLRIPSRHERAGCQASRWHLHVHRALELKPATILKVFKGCDAFRQPENLERLLLASEADARGRTGLENRDYPQADYLRRCYQAAAAISGRDVDGERFQGKAFGEELDRLRVEGIGRVLSSEF